MAYSKTAVAILAHKNIDYIIELARIYPDTLFVVHYDLKAKFDESKKKGMPHNLHFIEKRISVYWAGYSQVEAAIKLFTYIIKFEHINYIHLMSAECFPLIPFSEMEREWEKVPHINYIESHYRADNEWRVRTWMPHANTKHMRTIPGKVLKRILRFISGFINTSGIKDIAYYGSLWFSINKKFAERIVKENENGSYFKKYKRITCADEHAFASFIRTQTDCIAADNNKRYIDFPSGAANPYYLDLDDIMKMNDTLEQKNWFSRKFYETQMLNKLKEFKI
ncbi:beta-1,6-N-acetylglucosaminyltransferase [Cronobacter malonaticus]|uniref:Peptide O-xylosyltransferase n=1 Tax=Cronobacter sakazakii TaxID=28141 RepID=I1W2A4_CROSK|nr:WepN [Cronobacter sakazakii]